MCNSLLWSILVWESMKENVRNIFLGFHGYFFIIDYNSIHKNDVSKNI